MYKEISQGTALLGVNGNIPSLNNYPNLEAERAHLGEKILISNHAPVAQEFLKQGAPRSLRGRLWSLVLGSEIKENVNNHKKFGSLIYSRIRYRIEIN